MDPVRAAGAVVTRRGGDVLLVHRPKYGDWSFPKGKLDAGEHVLAAAVREVAEETGLDVRLGPPLASQRYPLANGRTKSVSYWTGRVVGGDDVSGFRPNDEIDRVEWVAPDQARDRLSYDYDRATLAEAKPLRRKTRALVVLRHAQARKRGTWKHDDRLRPLLGPGADQAQQLVPMLAAFGVSSVHTSVSTRCLDTVLPYARARGCSLTTYDKLTEERADVQGIVNLVDRLLEAREDTVICAHRPVLPTVVDAVGVPDVTLDLAQMLVVHHRAGRVVATELHLP